MILIFIIIFLTVLFLLYIQFSPQMGNIWWREGYFTPMGAINVIIYPLREIKMWNMEMWDINYFIWIIIVVITNLLYNYINSNLLNI